MLRKIMIIKSKIFTVFTDILWVVFRSLPFGVKKAMLEAYYTNKSKKYRLGDDDQFPLPEGVFFELRTKCSGRCSFCAASIQNETRPDSVMEFGLFNKVITELADLDYSGRVAFHVNNEPLIVPDLEKYLSLTREKLPRAWIQILTNGRSLSIKRAESLMEAKVNEITVNHYDDDDYLKQILPPRFASIRDEVISKYYPKKFIRSGHGPGKFNVGTVFRYNVMNRRETEVLTNRAASAPNKEGLVGENMLGFCQYPFIQFNITTDGRVGLCCADLYFKSIMGNVKNQTVSEIWFGKEFQAERKALLANDRTGNSLCQTCDFVGVKGRLFPKLLR